MDSAVDQKQDHPRRVSRNAITQVAGRLVYLATRVGLPPFVLHHISIQEYGIWATCFLIISYIGIGAFGVSNVYIRFVAEYLATGRQNEIGRLIATGLSITLSFSVVVYLGLWLLMPHMIGWFKIPAELQATARVLILGSVATMLLDMTFGAFAYVLTGMHRIVEQTTVWMASVLLETLLIVLLLVQGYGVEGMLWAFVIRYLFATVIYALLVYRALPGLRLTFSGPGRSPVRLFASYGGAMQLTGLLGIFLYSCERFISGLFNGVASVGVLDIGQKFPVMSSQVFSSATSSILVGLTHLHSTKQFRELVSLYRRSARYINALNGSAMGFMAAFATPLIVAWVGPNPAYHDAGPIMVYGAVGFQLHALTGPATTYFQSINHPFLAITRFQIPQLVLLGSGLAVSLTSFEMSLLTIVAVAAAARILSSLGLILLTNRRLGFSQVAYFRDVILPGVIPYVIGYGLFLFARGWLEQCGSTRLMLIPHLAALAALYGLLLWITFWILMDQEERKKWRQLLRRLGFAT